MESRSGAPLYCVFGLVDEGDYCWAFAQFGWGWGRWQRVWRGAHYMQDVTRDGKLSGPSQQQRGMVESTRCQRHLVGWKYRQWGGRHISQFDAQRAFYFVSQFTPVY